MSEIKIFKASNIGISRRFGSSDTILFLSSSKKTAEARRREEEKNGVLTEVGGLGDEGQESGSGEGDLGPIGASWWGETGATRSTLATTGGGDEW